MAAKKDFGQVMQEALTKSINSDYKQTTAAPDETLERRETMQTQGRKGVKAIRINMAFTPSNHEFIKTMSKATGKSMGEFTNLVIAAYRKEHPELLAGARAFIDIINAGFSADTDGADTETEN